MNILQNIAIGNPITNPEKGHVFVYHKTDGRQRVKTETGSTLIPVYKNFSDNFLPKASGDFLENSSIEQHSSNGRIRVNSGDYDGWFNINSQNPSEQFLSFHNELNDNLGGFYSDAASEISMNLFSKAGISNAFISGISYSYLNLGLSVGATTLDSSAILELTSTTKGTLLTRMTEAERDLIAVPSTSLLVFNTDTLKYNFWDGANWQIFNSSISGSNTLSQTLAIGNNTSGYDIVIDSNDNIALYDNSGGTGVSRIQWNNVNYLEYNDVGDALMEVHGDAGILLRTSFAYYSYDNAGNIVFNSGGITIPTVTFATNTTFGTLSHLALSGVRTWNLPDASGTIALTSDLTGFISTADNGLTKTLSNVALGGALTANTTISGAFDLLFSNTNFKRSGNIIFTEGAHREINIEQSTGVAGYNLTIKAGDGAIGGLGSGGNLVLNPGAHGGNVGGAPGDIYITGLNAVLNTIGTSIFISSGSSANNDGGPILITTGNGAGIGSGGNYTIVTGSGISRGRIRFQDGSEGTSGHVWTSTGISGEGNWSALPADLNGIYTGSGTIPTSVIADITDNFQLDSINGTVSTQFAIGADPLGFGYEGTMFYLFDNSPTNLEGWGGLFLNGGEPTWWHEVYNPSGDSAGTFSGYSVAQTNPYSSLYHFEGTGSTYRGFEANKFGEQIYSQRLGLVTTTLTSADRIMFLSSSGGYIKATTYADLLSQLNVPTIYTANSTITSNRTVTLGGTTLQFNHGAAGVNGLFQIASGGYVLNQTANPGNYFEYNHNTGAFTVRTQTHTITGFKAFRLGVSGNPTAELSLMAGSNGDCYLDIATTVPRFLFLSNNTGTVTATIYGSSGAWGIGGLAEHTSSLLVTGKGNTSTTNSQRWTNLGGIELARLNDAGLFGIGTSATSSGTMGTLNKQYIYSSVTEAVNFNTASGIEMYYAPSANNGTYTRAQNIFISKSGANNTSNIYAQQALARNDGAGNISELIGVNAVAFSNAVATISNVYALDTNYQSQGGTITNFGGLRIYSGASNVGTITNMYGIIIESPQNAGATVTNTYGLRINSNTTGTNNWGLYQDGSSVKNFFWGDTGIGSAPYGGAKFTVLAPVGYGFGSVFATNATSPAEAIAQFRDASNNVRVSISATGVTLVDYRFVVGTSLGSVISGATFLVKGSDASGSTLNAEWTDNSNNPLLRLVNNGNLGLNVAPTSSLGDRFRITAGTDYDGAINISSYNLANNGYAILNQGSTGYANYNGIWSVALGGTGTIRGFTGAAEYIGAATAHGGYFSARNGSSESVGVVGVANGGDSVNPGFAAIGVMGYSAATVATNRRGGYFYVTGGVNNGISYGAKLEIDANGTNGVNYGLHSRINGNGATVVNIGVWAQADGGSGAANYAIVVPSGGGFVNIGNNVNVNGSLLEISGDLEILGTVSGIVLEDRTLTGTRTRLYLDNGVVNYEAA